MQDNNVNMQQNYADIQEKWNMIDSNSSKKSNEISSIANT